MNAPLPSKRQVFDALLKDSSSVFIHMCPARQGANVPPWLRNKLQVVFQVGLDMPVKNMLITEELFSADLLFKGETHTVSFPWSAVFAIIDESARGMAWKSEMPDELAQAFAAPKAPASLVTKLKPAAQPTKLADTLPRVEGKGPPRNNVVSLDGWCRKTLGKGLRGR